MKHQLYAMLRSNLKDGRLLLLAAAFGFALLAAVMPPFQMTRKAFDVLVVVDITGSMNTRDYTLNGVQVSRLTVTKLALKKMLQHLPCSSRLALGLFSERISFLLFEPTEICKNYGALDKAIEAIDWREAWEGDSHVATGLFRAIDIARSLDCNLLFMTDGQEAPPLPLMGGPVFDGQKGEVRGLILGVGGYALSPIPKFDDRGNEIGFWGVDDVPHESRFGAPPADAEAREGYEARNAPFGAVAPKGTEHLSSVRETYLKTLADTTGLAYAHLADSSDIAKEIETAAQARAQLGTYDARWLAALCSFICLMSGFLFSFLDSGFRPVVFRRLRHHTSEVH